MNKKIIIYSTLIIILAVGAYLLFSNSNSNDTITDVPDMPDIDLSLSPLNSVNLPNIDFDTSMDFGSFDLGLAGINVGQDAFNIGDSNDVDINFTDSDFSSMSFGSTGKTSGNGSGSGSTSGVNSANCSKFSSAPSCSYVPAQYQDLCEQCKTAGY